MSGLVSILDSEDDLAFPEGRPWTSLAGQAASLFRIKMAAGRGGPHNKLSAAPLLRPGRQRSRRRCSWRPGRRDHLDFAAVSRTLSAFRNPLSNQPGPGSCTAPQLGQRNSVAVFSQQTDLVSTAPQAWQDTRICCRSNRGAVFWSSMVASHQAEFAGSYSGGVTKQYATYACIWEKLDQSLPRNLSQGTHAFEGGCRCAP